MSHDVFICHSSKDRTLANAICAKLEANRIRCWIAPRDVVPGTEYAQAIVEAIGASRLTVLVFSENANRSPHVHRELERTASHGIPILPFRVEDVVPAPSVEYFISDAHWLDALTPPMEEHLDYLVGTVRLILDREAAEVGAQPQPPASAAPAVATAPSPRPTGPHRRIWFAVLAALALVVVAAVVVVGMLMSGGDDTPAGGTPSGGATTSATAGGQPVAFVDEFDGGLAEGWAWQNEDPKAWAVEGGALHIDLQVGPPLRNVLLHEMPSGDFTVTTQIDIDPRASDPPSSGAPHQFAGLVLTGDDLANRLEFCWTSEGLSLLTWVDGTIRDGSQIAPDQFTEDEWIGAQLTIQVRSGFYTAVFSSQASPSWEIETKKLDPSFDRVGLVASTTEDAGGASAAFGRFVIQ
ncbi:MAG TPA: TIR domain-containing protein [Phycicoccus sp.]|nr:TIR domain-containing protein [Phycicoccus sp.]